MRILSSFLFLGLVVGTLSACRGWTTDKPPVHLNWNMDTQEKYKPYRKSDFFADGRNMRTPPEGTVARGQLRDDDAFERGITADARPVQAFPAQFTGSTDDMIRGKQRFEIYCAACHGKAGNGLGLVAARLAVKPPSFHDQRLKDMSVGQMYSAILNGVNNNNMPSYAAQIPTEDRWAILFYVRALQLAQDPTLAPFSKTSPEAAPTEAPAPPTAPANKP